MGSARSRLGLPLLFASMLAACASGCAATHDDDDVDGDAPASSGSQAVTVKPCLATDSALFFHGMSHYGRDLAKPGLCVPALENSGTNGFWSDVAFLGAPAATIVGGYSAGRIPLLRRLAKGDGLETTAVMLDGSYADGARFDGKTGPAIVDAWLEHDPARRFVLVYLPWSGGWREYAALASGPHAEQVKTCAVTGSHLELPALVTSQLFLDPETWVAERCAR